MAPGCGEDNPNHSRLTGKQGPGDRTPSMTSDEIIALALGWKDGLKIEEEVVHTEETKQNMQSTISKIRTFFHTDQNVPRCLECGIPAVTRQKLTRDEMKAAKPGDYPPTHCHDHAPENSIENMGICNHGKERAGINLPRCIDCETKITEQTTCSVEGCNVHVLMGNQRRETVCYSHFRERQNAHQREKTDQYRLDCTRCEEATQNVGRCDDCIPYCNYKKNPGDKPCPNLVKGGRNSLDKTYCVDHIKQMLRKSAAKRRAKKSGNIPNTQAWADGLVEEGTCVLKFSCKCDNCKFETYYPKEEVWNKWRFDLATGEQSKGEGCKKKQMVCKKGSCKCAHCNKSNGQYLTKGFKVEVYNGVEGKSGAGDKKKPAGLDAFGFATKKK